MKKLILASALALALPVLGMAASFSNVQFDNGDVTVSGTGGSTVNATFRVIVPAGQVVEYVQTDVVGDNLAPVDTSVGGELGLQEGTHDVTLSVKLPPNTGTYTLNVKSAGIYGGLRAISADDSSVGVVVSTGSFGSSLRVVASGSTSTAVGGSNMSFADLLAAIKLALGIGATPTPTVSSACAALTGKMVGTVQGVNNGANVRLQGFLLSEGASIPALSAGASFGFYGSQTASAVSWFKSVNACN